MNEKWIAIALGLYACGPSGEATSSAPEPESSGAEIAHACPTATSDIHDCAGMNSCSGLGGCSVDAEKLAWLAECRGISVAEAGDVHDCAGMNSCSGLGGCSVDAEKLEHLRADMEG